MAAAAGGIPSVAETDRKEGYSEPTRDRAGRNKVCSLRTSILSQP